MIKLNDAALATAKILIPAMLDAADIRVAPVEKQFNFKYIYDYGGPKERDIRNACKEIWDIIFSRKFTAPKPSTLDVLGGNNIVIGNKKLDRLSNGDLLAILAWFCGQSKIIWDDTIASKYELDFLDTIFGKLLTVAGCVKSNTAAEKLGQFDLNLATPEEIINNNNGTTTTTTNIGTSTSNNTASTSVTNNASTASASSQTNASSNQGANNVVKTRVARKGNTRSAVDTSTGGKTRGANTGMGQGNTYKTKTGLVNIACGILDTQKQNPSAAFMYSIQGEIGGGTTLAAKNKAFAHVKPLKSYGNANNGTANRVFVSSGNAYDDCKLFFVDPKLADDMMQKIKKDVNLGLVSNLQVVKSKIDTNGYFRIMTVYGEAYIKARKLNEAIKQFNEALAELEETQKQVKDKDNRKNRIDLDIDLIEAASPEEIEKNLAAIEAFDEVAPFYNKAD